MLVLAAAAASAVTVACGGATPPAGEPSNPRADERARADVPSPPIDAAPPEPAPVDAGPSAALLAAPAWVFRYHAPPRVETWTLRVADGAALLDVESAQGTVRYAGTGVQGASLVIDVAAPTATMKLECKPATRAIGRTCNDRKAAALDVLDCYHPDFAAPMTFAPAPGVEFSSACSGYRRLP